MYSNRTAELLRLYRASLSEDFYKWLRAEIELRVGKYLNTKIRYVRFSVEQEYDDNDYYDAISTIEFYDRNREYIDIYERDPEIFKEEYLDAPDDVSESVPDFDELRWGSFAHIMDEINELDLRDVMIDLEEDIHVKRY